MVAQPSIPYAPSDTGDRRFVVYGATWVTYVALRRALDDIHGLRITYLDGTMELMSPSELHEDLKTRISRLLEAYAGVSGINLNGYGSMTFRRKAKERGLEPDECYTLGAVSPRGRPDLAIEVITSRSAIDKLAVYAGLGVPEVWFWEKGKLSIHGLTRREYVLCARSHLVPGLDPALFARFVARSNQTRAVEEYRIALKKKCR